MTLSGLAKYSMTKYSATAELLVKANRQILHKSKQEQARQTSPCAPFIGACTLQIISLSRYHDQYILTVP